MKYKNKRWLLGLGFDSEDNHIRITRGDNFYLTGGSKNTHESMREKVMQFNEALKKKGKQLDDVTDKEIDDIAHKVGLRNVRKIKPARL